MASTFQLLLTLVTTPLIFYIVKFIKHRRFYSKLPGPPHSTFWGHLKLYGDTLALFPPRSHFMHVITTLTQKYDLPGLFYMDLWPLGPEQLIITDPELAAQYVNTRKLPKHPLIADYIDPILGEGNLITANGTQWKRVHDILAPAFSTAHVNGFTTLIIENVKVFHDILCERANAAEPFKLEEAISSLSFDVIFRALYGTPSGAQRQGNQDLQDLRVIVHAEMDRKQIWNPIKKWKLGQESAAAAKSLDASITSKVIARFDALQKEKIDLSKKRGLSIVDLILRERIQEADMSSKRAELDQAFLAMALPNIKAIMLGGSGTTADTLCFAFMVLSVYPNVVEKLREEHRRVFSADVDSTISMLETSPQKLNELEYTTNVLKETLRMYPIGNTGRSPDVPDPITYKGKLYPTKPHMIICPVQHTWHWNPDVFPDPDNFNPDRFSTDDKMTQTAWRPFERGQRACLGQSLAMQEMRMIMLLTIQYFDFKCYGLEPRSEPRAGWTKLDLVFGDRAFQEHTTEARPRDGMMMTVKKVQA